MIRESNGWQGIVNIKAINKQTGDITEDIVYNQVTNAGLNALINSLDGINPDLEVKYVAVGDSNTPLSPAMTQLSNEIGRVLIDSGVSVGIGQFESNFSVLDNELVGQWREIAFFCGSTATADPNTGTMLSRILYSRDKSSLEEIQISRLDRLIRG